MRRPLILGAVGSIQFLLTRAFSDGGRYPFSAFELVSILLFCGLGGALTWRVERAQTIRWIFVAYGVASLITFAIASPLGENIARVRFAALPIAVLVLSLRSWRPLPVAAVALVLAASWNLSPHAWSFSRATVEPTAHATYWQPAVDVPARASLALVPGRGRRHRRALGRRLPSGGGHSAHARLVPAGRLPSERSALRPR